MGTPKLASACFMVDAIVGACGHLGKRVLAGLLRFKGMAVAHGASGQVVVVVALCGGVGRFHVPIILGLGLVFEEEALGRERWGDFLA